MAVVSATCDRRDTPGGETITYTDVDADGELRDCPDCGRTVAIDPRAGEVAHVGTDGWD